MTKQMIRIHNVETNEIIDREMNDNELAQYELDLMDFANKKAKQLEAEAERQAILDRLGITAEEAQLLLS